jgi:hypothetical protein
VNSTIRADAPVAAVARWLDSTAPTRQKLVRHSAGLVAIDRPAARRRSISLRQARQPWPIVPRWAA